MIVKKTMIMIKKFEVREKEREVDIKLYIGIVR